MSVKAFREWLARQPGATRITPNHGARCLLGLFAAHLWPEFDYVWAGDGSAFHGFNESTPGVMTTISRGTAWTMAVARVIDERFKGHEFVAIKDARPVVLETIRRFK